jgi:hypothetical protein
MATLKDTPRIGIRAAGQPPQRTWKNGGGETFCCIKDDPRACEAAVGPVRRRSL